MDYITYTNEPEGIGALHQTSVSQTAPLHSHKDFMEAFLVIHGRALHISNEQVNVLTEGSFVLVRQHDVHCYSFYQSEQFDFYNLSLQNYEFHKVVSLFSGDSHITELLSRTTSPIIQLDEAELSQVRLKFEEIMNLVAQQKHTLAKIHFKLLLANMFVNHCFQDPDHSSEKPPLPGWLSDLITDMHLYENMQEGLPALLRLSGYSQEYLNRIFRKYLDLTPTQFINNIRLNQAAVYLSDPSANILDVCDHCGFHNLSHFYHLFKSFFGLSPKKYQKLCREQESGATVKV